MSSQPLTIGLIGYGKFSRFLASALSQLPEVHIHTIYDPQIVHARPPELDSTIRVARSVEELLNDSEIKAVHILTPPIAHAPLALAALSAGKHAVVEKPLALSLGQAKKIVKTAQKQNLVLGINYPLRYNPLLQAFQKLITQKTFGKLLWIRLENAVPQPPENHWFWDIKQSGGIHLEHGVHFFDAALWLVNEKPVDLTGSLLFRQQKNTEAFASIVFPGQTLARFSHGFLTVPHIQSTTWLLVWERARARIESWTPIQAEITAEALPQEISLLRELNFTVQTEGRKNIIKATQKISDVEDMPYADAIRNLWKDMATAIGRKEIKIVPEGASPETSVDLAERASRTHFRFPS